MRKINWIIGSITLGLGMVVGIVGYAVATAPATGNSLLTKLGVGKEAQMVSSTVKPDSNNPNLSSSTGTSSDTANSNSNQNMTNSSPNLNGDSLFPSSASGEANGTDNNGGGTITGKDTTSGSTSSSASVSNDLAQKIISDYKQDIGYFFGAWKSTDMIKFRSSLSKAYVGDLYEKHARQAEGFITQGLGMDVSDVRFDAVNVESATSNSATLEATYRYTAQDYSLGEETPQGDRNEHLVHIRVNLIQSNGRWLISGETPLD